MSKIMSQVWKIVKPHAPLIRFRKGVAENSVKLAGNEETAASLADKVQNSTHIPRRPVIEDWQLPPRYRRQVLDEKEINAINSGGAY